VRISANVAGTVVSRHLRNPPAYFWRADPVYFSRAAKIKDIAWAELQRAIERCRVPDARRFKAISEAEGMFRGCLKNQFPDLTAASADGTNKEATP
jgi:hypothetical protein